MANNIPENIRKALPGEPDPTFAIGAVTGPITPGTGAANLGKAEDSPHVSGDTGVAIWAVRRDAGGAVAADGDYIPLTVDSLGRLWVTPSAVGAITGPITPGTGATDLGKAEDAPHGSGDTGIAIWAVRSDSGAVLAADGDYIPLMTDSAGRLRIAGSVVVDPVVPGVGATNLGKAEDAPHASGDTGVAIWAVRRDAGGAVAADGDYIPLTVDSLGRLYVAPSAIGAITGPVTPGTGATDLGKADGAAYTPGDVGVVALGYDLDAGGLYHPIPVDWTGFSVPLLRVSGVSDAVPMPTIDRQSRSETSEIFAAAGVGVTDGFLNALGKYFGLQVVQTGVVTSWSVALEVSLDGTNFTPLITHTKAADGNGSVKFVMMNGAVQVAAAPAPSWRVNVTALVLGAGTNITVYRVASA